MSIRPLRQEKQVNIDFISPWTQERGGCASIVSLSGMYIAEYAVHASGAMPLGMQLNDIEWMDLSRQYHRTYSHPAARTDTPCGTVGIAVFGDFITDWITLVGDVFNGDPAYVGPSGTFTNSSSFGGKQIGTFLGSLDPEPHTVTYRGLGFSRQYMDPCDKIVKWENNPEDAVFVYSPGYISIRVDVSKVRSQ